MKKIYTILFASLLAILPSCTGKNADPDPEPDPVTPGSDTLAPVPVKPTYEDVALMDAFTETFSDKTSGVFNFAYRESEDDFRYFSGFPSWNEKGTDLLLMRVDPSDPSGTTKCPSITSKEHTFYGSYSIRMRLPDIKAVQPNVGLNVVFTATEQSEVNGYSTIETMWKMADPTLMYLTTVADVDRTNDRIKSPVTDFSPSKKYYTYGFDWHADKVTWWILVGSDKQTIKEVTEYVPCFPAVLKLMLYHSKNNPVEGNSNAIQAPSYPYEFEIDAISYEPYDDEIKAWHDEYFD